MKSGLKSLLAGVAIVVSATQIALAGQPLTVQADKSQLISVSAEPGAVVIGNPSIADITVNGKQIFVHGHAFGDTNLLVLDQSGNQIANFDITVANSAENNVAIFNPKGRFTYTCAPLCENVILPGDNFETTKAMLELSQQKTEFATGKKSAEAAAPAAPQ
jgi:Flp pilus assembly secretin CpaC